MHLVQSRKLGWKKNYVKMFGVRQGFLQEPLLVSPCCTWWSSCSSKVWYKEKKENIGWVRFVRRPGVWIWWRKPLGLCILSELSAGDGHNLVIFPAQAAEERRTPPFGGGTTATVIAPTKVVSTLNKYWSITVHKLSYMLI